MPELGRSPGEGKSYPLQHSGLVNSMDCIVHGGHKESERTELLSLSLATVSRPNPLPFLSNMVLFQSLQWITSPSSLLLLLSLQSCLALCYIIDSSPPGSSVPGILQARILEWVAISFSNACMHAKLLQSCLTLCNPMDSSPQGSSVHSILQARILEWVAISLSNLPTCVHAKHLGAILTLLSLTSIAMLRQSYLSHLLHHSNPSITTTITLCGAVNISSLDYRNNFLNGFYPSAC